MFTKRIRKYSFCFILIGILLFPNQSTLYSQTVPVQLYLSDPGNNLDRIDPVATGDNTTSSSSLSAPSGGSATISDDFSSGDYAGGSTTNASYDWTTDWIEVNDNNSSSSGNIRVSTFPDLEIVEAGFSSGAYVYREINLQDALTASLSILVVSTNFSTSDSLDIEISSNGGSSYVLLERLSNATNNQVPITKTYDVLPYANSNTRIRFRWSASAGSTGSLVAVDDISIVATFPTGSPSVSFIQNDAICGDLVLPANASIDLSVYANVTSGSMPPSPDVTAGLKYGSTTIATLSNPSYTSATGLLSWTATLASGLTVPSGAQIELEITDNEAAVEFDISYDSDTKPSKLSLNTSSQISLDAIGIYDGAYPGGSIITNVSGGGSTSYIRVTASSPFGGSDITSIDINTTSPGGTTNLTLDNSHIVGTTSCGRIFEYPWQPPNGDAGNNTVSATANQGFEGTNTATGNTDVTVTIGPEIRTKSLYLTNPTQGLDRIDPTTTTGATSSTSEIIYQWIDSINVTPVLDGIISNFGNGPNNEAGRTFSTCSGGLYSTSEERPYFKFDISGIPSGATIDSAKMFTHHSYVGGGSVLVNSHQLISLSAATTGCNVTGTPSWNSESGGNYSTTILDSWSTSPSTSGQFLEWDITSAAQSWYSTPTSNHGILLVSNGSKNTYPLFSSVEDANQPYLKVYYKLPPNASESFTMSSGMCSDFTIKAGEPISIETFATISRGTPPSSPDIDAKLQFGSAPTTIVDITTSPSWDGSKFVWTASLGSDLTIPSGDAISLIVTSNDDNFTFTIDYDSPTSPSRINFPASTFIDVASSDVYSASYSNGTILTENTIGETVYLRSTVSDPFGYDDITGLEYKIISPSNDTTTANGIAVDSSGCTKTYEYAWTIPDEGGDYSITATADEGTEGVQDDSTFTFKGVIPIVVKKLLKSPTSGPHTPDDNITYTLRIINEGTQTVTTAPIQDIFETSCLEYVSATTTPDNIAPGSLTWDDMGPIPANDSVTVDVTLKVVGNCDPARNIAKVEGATSALGILETKSDTLDLLIDESPVAQNDTFYISGTTDLDVLGNDSDPDNDMMTLTIASGPGSGSASVITGNLVQFIPSGMSDDQTTTFTYQICDNASPTPYCDNATVTVVFSNVNDAPVLGDDMASTTINLDMTVGVLDNDSDVDGNLDISSMTITSGPTYGTAQLNADGTITYTPNPDYTGPDQLTYQICDDGLPLPSICETATLDLTVIFAHYACQDGSTTLSVPEIPGADGYNWSLPAGAVITSTPTDSNVVEIDFSAVSAGTYEVCVEPTNDCGDGTQQCVDVVVTDVMLASAATDALCNGSSTGSIDLTPTGGVSPYTYNWAHGATVEDLDNLTAGTYSVTVTDRYGCSANTSILVGEPATTVSISGSTIVDENPYGSSHGSIDITVTGGTPGYLYEWKDSDGNIISTSQDASGLPGGTYTVLVTDSNGCTDEEVFTVNYVGGPLMATQIIATDVLCNGESTGSVDLEVIGGATPYNYNWTKDGSAITQTTQDLSNVAAGIYAVTITDANSNTTTATATISEPTSVLSVSSSATNVSCKDAGDGTIDATVTGGTSPYQYKWTNGATSQDLSDLAPGSYTLTVTDANGCTATTNNSITEPSALLLTALMTETKCATSGTGALDLTVSGGASPYSYAWSNNATTQDLTGLTAGSYSVTVTDANTCSQIATFEVSTTCIGAAKEVVGTPINNGDGSYTLKYNVLVENMGDSALSNIQVLEDLEVTFADADTFIVDHIFISSQPSSNSWALNANYDGRSDTLLLSGSPSLESGESSTIQLTITVVPGTNLSYDNNAEARGENPEGIMTSDSTHNGSDPDPDDNKIPGDNSDPTPVTFTENPEIGVAKLLDGTPTNNSDGTYTVSYLVRIENTGDVPIYDLQLADTLTNTFPNLTLSNISTSINMQPGSTTLHPNASYDGDETSDVNILGGSDTLKVGEFGIVQINLTVAIDGNLGPYNNSAEGSGTSPAGSSVIDTSHNGTDVDPEGNGPDDNETPTPVSFSENPQVSVTKTISGTPMNNGDGTYTVSYLAEIQNTGDVPLHDVQVGDNLSTTFSGLTLSNVSVEVNTQPANSTLTANNNFDGMTAGDTTLLNPADTLLVGEVAILKITCTVTLDGSLGPYVNTAYAEGKGPGGTAATDDDFASLVLMENPSIGVAKAAGTPTNNQDGTYDVSYTIVVENTGDVPLTSIQVLEDLDVTFSAADTFIINSVTSTDFSISTGFDGKADSLLLDGSDNLDVGAAGSIEVNLTVTPGTYLGVYDNTAKAMGTSSGGIDVTDNSYDGSEVDPDDDGDPTNNEKPTPLSFPENPLLGVAKDITSAVTNNGNGTYSFTYQIKVENTGDVPLLNVQVVDDLSTTFTNATSFAIDGFSIVTQPGSTSFNLNSNYDGDSDAEMLHGGDTLLVGEFAVLDIDVTVNPGLFPGPYNNTAISYGTSTGGRTIVDYSQDGTDVDPDSDGNPKNNNEPTPVEFNSTNAEDDFNQTVVGIPVSGDVSTNDYDNEGDNQTVTSALADTDGNGVIDEAITIGTATAVYGTDTLGNHVAAGTIALNGDGTYTYVPVAGFVGTVLIDYTTTDDNTDPATDNAQLVIEVSGPQPDDLYPPVAQNDNATTEPGEPVDIQILVNDNDVDGTIDATSVDLDHTSITGATCDNTDASGDCTEVTVPGEGSYTVNEVTGLVTFTPEEGFIGTTTPLPYEVCDDDGLCTTAEITVYISQANVNEMSAEDDANYGYSGSTMTGDILLNDIDPDGSSGTPSVASATFLNSSGAETSLTIGSSTDIYVEDPDNPGSYIIAGNLTVNSNGSYTYISDPGYDGTVSVPYTACDNDSDNACDNATLYLTTTAPNTTIAEDDINQTVVNVPVSGDVSTNDYDPQADSQTVTAALADSDGDGTVDDAISTGSPATIYGTNELGATVPAGTITLNSDGTYDYSPAIDFMGNVEIIYTVTDDNGNPASDDATLVIEVSGEITSNEYPPVATNDFASTEPGVAVTLSILDNDHDVDGMIDPTTVSLDHTSVTGATCDATDSDGDCTTVTVPNEGTYVVNTTTGEVTFTPLAGFSDTTAALTYTVCDDSGLCTQAAITVGISTTGNNEMSASPDYNSGMSGETLTGNVLDNDLDPDGSTGTPSVSGGTYIDANGMSQLLTIGGAPTDIYTENPENPGQYMLAGTLVLNSDGTYSYVSDPDFTGTASVTYAACDNDANNACETTSLTLQVQIDMSGLTPPVANDDNATTLPNTAVSIGILSNDNDVDGVLDTSSVHLLPLSVSGASCTSSDASGNCTAVSVPGEGTYSVNQTTGVVTFTPSTGFTGITTPLMYEVCDNDGLCDEAEITVVVVDATANVMTAEDDANLGYSGAMLTGNILPNDLDPDGSNGTPDVGSAKADTDGDGIPDDALTFGQSEDVYGEDPDNPGNYILAGQLTLNQNGTYQFQSVAGFKGTVIVPYQACDNNNGPNACDNATLYLTVLELCYTLDVKVLLEGPYDSGTDEMTTLLNSNHLLPGQDLGENDNPLAGFLGEATPIGQPYSAAPWNHNGTEGDGYGDEGTNPGSTPYPSTVTDWVLVSIRATDSLETSEVWKCAGLLHSDGSVTFPDACDCLELSSNVGYYIVIEHRNHLPVMSSKQTPTADVLSFDFTTQDSWKFLFGVGSIEVETGVWAMHAGNGATVNRTNEKDINSNDKSNWGNDNGQIFKYRFGDHNLDTDTNSDDKTIWGRNNGKVTFIPFN